MRVLTLRELNRATLARQLLLERGRVPVVRAVERVAGLQAQWAPAPYVGLWTRVEGFRRAQLERALLGRKVVRATVMRGTVHVVSARDYPVLVSAVGEPPWVRGREDGLGAGVYEAVAAFAREPRSRAEIASFVGRELDDRTWYALRARARLSHAPETGFWKPKGGARYVVLPLERTEAAEARRQLVRRYLAAFGPATRADAAEWSGLRVADVEPALTGLPQLRDEHGRTLFDLPRAPRPAGDSPAPVRFLPRFDNLVLSHKDRNRVIADEHRGDVIDGGWVKSTFLVDGFVAGTWEADPKGKVTISPFAPLPRTARREVEDEARRLEDWLR